MHEYIHTDIIDFFTTHKNCKKSKCSSTSDWLNKLWYTMRYDADIKTMTHVYGERTINIPREQCVCLDLQSSSIKLIVVSLSSEIMVDFCNFLYSFLKFSLIGQKIYSSWRFLNIYHFYLIEIANFVRICRFPQI